jgi:excisionase family DNA binding protein
MIEIKQKKYYTLRELSEMFNVNQYTISAWRRSGKLKSFKLNERHFLFSEDNVQDFIEKEK